MARILGVEIPNEKRIDISLTYIHGVGSSAAKKILELANLDPAKRAKDVTEAQLSQLAKIITDNFTVEGELKQEIFRNIKRLKEIKSYRGLRHKLGLPVRGQRTKTNAVTRKGRNLAVGGLKRKLEKT